MYLDQPLLVKFLYQLHKVVLASISADLVFEHDRVANLPYCSGGLNLVPHDGANIVEPEIKALIEMKDHGLRIQYAGHLLLGGDNNRVGRNSHVAPLQTQANAVFYA